VTAETAATVHIYTTEEVRRRLTAMYAVLAELGRRARSEDNAKAERTATMKIEQTIYEAVPAGQYRAKLGAGDTRHNRPGVEHGGLRETTY